jgi:hypothetical protein
MAVRRSHFDSLFRCALLRAKSEPSFAWFSFRLCRFFSLLQSINTVSLFVHVRPSGVRHFARFVPIDLAQQWQQLAQHHTSRCLFLSAS